MHGTTIKKMTEGIPMAWKNEPMELTDKLQLNNTGQLEITDVNSISKYVEPKEKLNSHLNTGHSEMKYKVSKRHRNCPKTKTFVLRTHGRVYSIALASQAINWLVGLLAN
jgi:hypothetical protein